MTPPPFLERLGRCCFRSNWARFTYIQISCSKPSDSPSEIRARGDLNRFCASSVLRDCREIGESASIVAADVACSTVITRCVPVFQKETVGDVVTATVASNPAEGERPNIVPAAFCCCRKTLVGPSVELTHAHKCLFCAHNGGQGTRALSRASIRLIRKLR